MLPSFVYSLAFWRALSVLIAVAVVQLGYADSLDAVKVEAAILAFLLLFDIEPELRAKGLK